VGGMDLTISLSEEEMRGLRAYANRNGVTVEEAARSAILGMVRDDKVRRESGRLRLRDQALLDRLGD
jgi:hypothetical protein